MSTSRIKIGNVALNSRLGRLEDRAGKALHLRPKSYRMLEVLAEHRGELVSKDDLAAAVWRDVAVTDESVSQCVSDIRRALGADSAKLLRTVPRRGYVLEAEPNSFERPAMPARSARIGAVIAIAALAGLAAAYWVRDVGRETTFAAPAKVTAESVTGIPTSASLDWRDRTANNLLRADVNSVLDNDPRDAEAWAKLAATYWLEVKYSAWGGGRRELGQALAAIERSLQLGGSAAAYRLLTEVRLDAPFPDARSPIDALAAARAAFDLSPQDPDSLAILAGALTANGHAGEAIPFIEQAIRTVATPPDRYREIAGLSYLLAGEPAKAVEEFGHLHGAGTYSGARHYTGWFLASSLALAGRTDEASTVVVQARMKRPEQTLQTVALALEGLGDQHALDVVLDGLRRAGMPG